MSIILDALKKLDRERSDRPDGPPNIGTEILRPDPPFRGKRTPLYFATILLTAVAATAITYAVVVWFGFPSKSGPPTSMSSPAPKQPVKPASPEAISPPKSGPPASVNSSAPSQQVIPDPPSHEPARASGEEIRPESSKIQNPPENKDPATPLGEKKGGQNVIPEKADAVPGNKGKGVEPIPSGSAMSPPPLRITAIGWDEDPSKRFAFVNGMMAHEGDIIEEAKIVEIYPKRIRFLHNGQYFEIRM
jgi:hypothetical protein